MRIHLGLGDTLRESLSVSPMNMDVGADLLLGWDWISRHDLHHLYADGQVRLRWGTALLQLDLRHGEFRLRNPRAVTTLLPDSESRHGLACAHHGRLLLGGQNLVT